MKRVFAAVMAVMLVSPVFAHDAAKIRDIEKEMLDLKKEIIELKQQNMELEESVINLEKKLYGKSKKTRFYVVKVKPTEVPTPVPTAVPTVAPAAKIQIIDVKARPEALEGRSRVVSYVVTAVNNTRYSENGVVITLVFKDSSDRVLHQEVLGSVDFNRREEKKISGEIRMRKEKADAITAVTAEIK